MNFIIAEGFVGWGLDLLWQQVGHLECQVLNDNVELLILVLSTWDRDVTNLLGNGRNDDMSEILDQMRLVLEVSCGSLYGHQRCTPTLSSREKPLTITIESQALNQVLDINTQLLVERIFIVSIEEFLDSVEEIFAVSAVFLVPELLSRFLESATIFIALIGHDITLFLKDSSEVGSKVAPPVSELGVVTCIGIHDINCIDDGLHRSIVGEALEENAEFHFGIGVDGVAADIHALASSLVLDVGSAALVPLKEVNEEVNSLIVIFVLLLFNDDLCREKTG